MDDRRLDPDAPIPGPPDPWAETQMPSLRDGPPWHMTEMIEAEPALAVRILERLAADGSAARLAGLVREYADAGRPIVTVGCGTSEHGAQAVAEILAEAIGLLGGWMGSGEAARPTAVQAFEAMNDLGFAQHRSLVVGISHEGATWATMEALDRAVHGNAATALITVTDRSPAAAEVDVVLQTGELDTSWCHTIGYLSPIVAGISVVSALLTADPDRNVDPVDPREIRDLLAQGLTPEAVAAIEAMAAELARCERIVVIGSGADRIAARELALKIEEGTHLPAAMRDLETLLHGHLAGMDERTGLVAIGAHMTGMGDTAKRMTGALRAAQAIGVRSAAILTSGFTEGDGIPDALTPAGRVVIEAPAFAPAFMALLATAIPLQLLTERIARVRGVNPDPIRRDDPRYLRAAEVAGQEA